MGADWIVMGFLVANIMVLAILDLTYEVRMKRKVRRMYLEVARKRKLTRR